MKFTENDRGWIRKIATAMKIADFFACARPSESCVCFLEIELPKDRKKVGLRIYIMWVYVHYISSIEYKAIITLPIP